MRSYKLLKALFSLPDPREPSREPEPPRLGILHLMVLTACVAVCMGVMRTIAIAAEELPALGSHPFLAARGTLYGIGRGGALAGLILLVARRLRRIRFPVHPGEYLLIISAVGAVLQAVVYRIFLAMAQSDTPFFVILALATFVINVPFFIWALIGVKRRRWRIFLLSIPVCHVLGYQLIGRTMGLMGPGGIFLVVQNVAPLAASVVLAVVVIQDHLEGRRYPWSHWMGIAVRLCFDVVRILSLVWIMGFVGTTSSVIRPRTPSFGEKCQVRKTNCETMPDHVVVGQTFLILLSDVYDRPKSFPDFE